MNERIRRPHSPEANIMCKLHYPVSLVAVADLDVSRLSIHVLASLVPFDEGIPWLASASRVDYNWHAKKLSDPFQPLYEQRVLDEEPAATLAHELVPTEVGGDVAHY